MLGRPASLEVRGRLPIPEVIVVAIGVAILFAIAQTGVFVHIDTARVSAAAIFVVITSLGSAHYRSIVNPVSAMALPMVGALLAEEIVLRQGAIFGWTAALDLVACVMLFTAGAFCIASPQDVSPRVTVCKFRTRQIRAAMNITVMGLAALTIPLALYAKRIFLTAAANVGASTIDRSTVTASLAGSSGGLETRAVDAYTLLMAIPVGLLWTTKSRLRYPTVLLYAVGAVEYGNSQRARLPTLLGVGLVIITILVGQRVTRGRLKVGRVLLIATVLFIFVYYAFSEIYKVRHGYAPSAANFFYAIAGGPSGLSAVVDGHQVVRLDNGHGVSIEGLLSLVGRSRTLGNFSAVQVGPPPIAPINIYSAPGVFIFDWGIWATLVIYFVAGIVTGKVWQRVVERPTAGSVAIMAGILLWCASNIVGSLTQYNFWWAIWVSPVILNRIWTVRRRGEATPRSFELLAMPDEKLIHEPPVTGGPCIIDWPERIA